jgi:hypothetical protein
LATTRSERTAEARWPDDEVTEKVMLYCPGTMVSTPHLPRAWEYLERGPTHPYSRLRSAAPNEVEREGGRTVLCLMKRNQMTQLGFGVGDELSLTPPNPLEHECSPAPRTNTYATKAWALSLVQGPFSSESESQPTHLCKGRAGGGARAHSPGDAHVLEEEPLGGVGAHLQAAGEHPVRCIRRRGASVARGGQRRRRRARHERGSLLHTQHGGTCGPKARVNEGLEVARRSRGG